jgi:HD-GYP domain-containing protein (c-di-GMP phosphodiesterase class II)/DNA-binding CsgD family transcriptional regulator
VSDRPRLAEICAVLSLATDLAVGQPLESGLRACLIAQGLGAELGLTPHERHDLYYLTLLRMAGCTSTPELASMIGDPAHMGEVFYARGADFGEPRAAMPLMLKTLAEGEPVLGKVRNVARAMSMTPAKARELQGGHCEVAQRLASRIDMPDAVIDGLGFVYERWDGSGLPAKARGEAIPALARIMHVAVHAEVHHSLGGFDGAVRIVKARAGRAIDPSLADRFCERAKIILEVLDEPSPWSGVLAAEPVPVMTVDEAGLDDAASVLGSFSEAAVWARGHSRSVARLVEAAAEAARIPSSDRADASRAALVHDLGMVTVRLPVWTKAGPLSDLEWDDVRLHAYQTERLLGRTTGLRRAAEIAGLHHERLDGSGYHRGAGTGTIPMAARVLAAADVYESMISERPYRAAWRPDAAAAELERMAAEERLDAVAVAAVLGATGGRTSPPPAAWPAGLTDREVEVLRSVARGLSIKQAARELAIRPKTVDGHLQRLYRKIGVSTRAAATLFAVESGLLDDTSDA